MPPLATVGILSIGDMGMGIAKLLVAHNYRVVTNLEGRRLVKMLYMLFYFEFWNCIVACLKSHIPTESCSFQFRCLNS